MQENQTDPDSQLVGMIKKVGPSLFLFSTVCFCKRFFNHPADQVPGAVYEKTKMSLNLNSSHVTQRSANILELIVTTCIPKVVLHSHELDKM